MVEDSNSDCRSRRMGCTSTLTEFPWSLSTVIEGFVKERFQGREFITEELDERTRSDLGTSIRTLKGEGIINSYRELK